MTNTLCLGLICNLYCFLSGRRQSQNSSILPRQNLWFGFHILCHGKMIVSGFYLRNSIVLLYKTFAKKKNIYIYIGKRFLKVKAKADCLNPKSYHLQQEDFLKPRGVFQPTVKTRKCAKGTDAKIGKSLLGRDISVL